MSENLNGQQATADGTPGVEPAGTSQPNHEEKPIYAGGKAYLSTEELARAYDNLTALNTSQSIELGNLREKPVVDPEPELDLSNEDSIREHQAWNNRELERKFDAKQAKAQKDQEFQRSQASLNKFIQSHSDISVGHLQKVTQYADSNGLDMTSAYSQMTEKGLFSKPGVKEHEERANLQAQPTLGRNQEGTTVEVDGDAIDAASDANPDALANYTPEQREKWLMGEL